MGASKGESWHGAVVQRVVVGEPMILALPRCG